jgi:uncharacterized repeat protein (TIGR03803 family)
MSASTQNHSGAPIAAVIQASDGTFTVLHNFDGGSYGGGPLGGVISDSAGHLYGTTFEGGGADCSTSYLNGCGTVFKLKE